MSLGDILSRLDERFHLNEYGGDEKDQYAVAYTRKGKKKTLIVPTDKGEKDAEDVFDKLYGDDDDVEKKDTYKSDRDTYESIIKEDEEFIDPDDRDIIITQTGRTFVIGLGDGVHVSEARTWKEAIGIALEFQKQEPNFFPQWWFVDERGNTRRIDNDGNEIVEGNTTSNLDGGLGQPKTPFAFQSGTSKDKKKERENATSSTGYGIVKVTNNYTKRKDEIFNRITSRIDELNELRYTDYVADASQTAKQKINTSISEINRKVYEVDRMINHAIKLKTEAGMNQDIFWKSTLGKFAKISERLLTIGNKLREFNK